MPAMEAGTMKALFKFLDDFPQGKLRPDALSALELLSGVEKMVHVSDYGFYIDKYEVTNAEYAAFFNEKGNQSEGGVTWLEDDSMIKKRGSQFTPKSGYGDHPMIEVSWYGAKAYCEWAGKRLPTEYEWELVATFGGTTSGPWGDELKDCNGKSVAIKGCNLTLVTDGGYGPRKIKTSNDDVVSFGGQEIYDMGGNVSEWVEDIYDRFQSCKNEIKV